VESINVELRPSESLRFFAISAGKKEKKMTHSKQTTLYLPPPELPLNSYQPIEAVIGVEATNH
jgi:hypothetical protein